MFYHLQGELCLADATQAVVDCGGVGYQVTISANTANALSDKLGQKVKLFTYLAVREDGVELFGFRTREELSCFKLLITVSGVGPKAALSILSVMTPDRFSFAVCTEDAKALAKAPGIGAKTAARIVLELKDKISKDTVSGIGANMSAPAAPAGGQDQGKLSEAIDALTVLGYSRSESLDALKSLDLTKLTLEQIITAALKYFASKG
jgi:Holliday junction DNA helicase RuvA